MRYEVEQKYRLVDPGPLLARLATWGLAVGVGEIQVDAYFAHPARDFAQSDEALRVRRVGRANCLTYKGPKLDHASKTRQELELALPPDEPGFAAAAELLLALGFSPVAEVRKSRRRGVFPHAGLAVEIAIDSVAGLGDFVELEVVADDAGLERARQALAAVAESLGLAPSAVERRSYLELLLAARATSTPAL
jgi:adenylate cyclase, class 2